MDELPRPLSDVMQPTTIEEIYRAKEARRHRLAALPLTEKVRLMEKLQAAGRTCGRRGGSDLRWDADTLTMAFGQVAAGECGGVRAKSRRLLLEPRGASGA